MRTRKRQFARNVVNMKNTSRRNDRCVPVEALTTNNMPPAELFRARLKRIDQYESEGLASPAPFAALMTAVQADLFRDVGVAADAAKRAIMSSNQVEGVWNAETPINRCLDIVRQIARNADLELRARRAGKYAANPVNTAGLAATPDPKLSTENPSGHSCCRPEPA